MATDLNSTELSSLTTDEAGEVDYIAGLDSTGAPVGDSFAHYLSGPNGNVYTYGNGSTVTVGFYSDSKATDFTATEEDNAWQALQLWSGLANIAFSYTGDSNTTDLAGTEIHFVHAFDTFGKKTLPAGTSYTTTSASASGTTGIADSTSGYIQIDDTTEEKDSNGKPIPGTLGYGDIGSYTAEDGYGIDTLVHEVGHLMGLGHAGNYNFTVDPSTQQRSEYDTRTWSIMSYIDPGAEAFNGAGKYVTPKYEPDYTVSSDFATEAPFTPMGLDIFAAQRIDGAPTSTMFSGGQTFGFTSTVMYAALDGTQKRLSMYDFAIDTRPVVTLYDYGTGNTLDLSGFTAAQTIDLVDGTFSSVAGLTNNLFIEWGTQIDRLVGGSGDDVVTLNARADEVDGGGGTNTAILPGNRADYSASLSGPDLILTRDGVSDDLRNIQTFQFADGTETLADLQRPGRTLDGTVSPVRNTGHLFVTANQVLTLKGSVANTGRILIDGDASSGAATLAVSGTVTLSGGGAVDLADLYDGTHATVAIVAGAVPGDTLDNIDNTISGYGEIGQGTLTLVNEAGGSIIASANALTLDTGYNRIINHGLMQGRGGGLVIDSTVANDGHIETSNGGSLLLNSAILNANAVTVGPEGTLYLADGGVTGTASKAGVFDVAFSGTIEVTGTGNIDGTLQTVDLEGTVTVDAAAALTLTGTVQNTGSIRVEGNASSGNAVLQVAGDVVLTGGGLVELVDLYDGTHSTVALIRGGRGIDSLVNVDNSILGYGEITGPSLSLVNGAAGSILAVNDTLTLATGSNVIINEGELGASQAELVIDSAVQDDGVIVAEALGTVSLHADVTGKGVLGVANSGTVALSGARIGGGVSVKSYAHGLIEVTGTGSLDGSKQALNLQGTTRVDAGGVLTLTGAVFDYGAIEVDGNAASAAATLDVSGTVTLTGGGTLTLADLYDGTHTAVAVVTGAGGLADLLDNAVDAITGYGELGAGALSFTNETAGTVTATANTLILHTAATRNAGTFTALANATLVIEAAVDDAGGDIVAAGGIVQLGGDGVGTTIAGGTLSASNGGTFTVDGAGAMLDSTDLADTALIVVGAGDTLTAKGTLANHGTIALDGNASTAAATLGITGTVQLTGDGSIELRDLYDGNNSTVAVIDGSSTADTLDNLNNTIRGYGQLGAGSLAIVNEAAGVVDATADTLTLDTGFSIIINHGLLESTGGTLAIDSSMASTGQIVAASGGTVTLRSVVNNSGSVQVKAGGRLVLAGGDVFGAGSVSVAAKAVAEVVANSMLDGSRGPLTLAGIVTVDAGTVLTAVGTVNNSGTVSLDGNASTAAATLGITGTVQLTGGGSIELRDLYDGNNSTVAVIDGSSTADTLDNLNNTIRGYGQLGAGSLAIVNEAGGTIDATADTLTVDGGKAGIINRGLLEATGSGTLVITDTTGAVQNSGVIHLGGGTLAAATLGNSGLIDGHGTIDATIGNTGTIAAEGGTLTLAQAASGTLSVAARSTLDLAVGVSPGAIIGFGGTGATLQIDGGGTTPVSVTGFGPGNTILLTGVADDPAGSVTLQAGNLLAVTEDGLTYDIQLDPTQSYGGETFTGTAAPDGSLQLSVAETGPLEVQRGERLIVDATAAAAGAPISIGSTGTGVATLQIDGLAMPSNVIDGLLAGDVINLADIPFDLSGTAQLDAGNVLRIVEGGHTYTLALDPNQSFANEAFTLSDPVGTDITVTSVACYVRGTRIATPAGETAVEDLRAGGLVLTQSGAARPIRWIGRRSYAGRFILANPEVWPIRFRAGSLGGGLPRRDLLVSPDHAMMLDGLLIPARCLVNAGGITPERGCPRVDYFHVELDTHDVLLAEGAPSESFVDDDNRNRFHNAAGCPPSHRGSQPALYCAPRVESGFALEAIRRRLAATAALAA